MYDVFAGISLFSASKESSYNALIAQDYSAQTKDKPRISHETFEEILGKNGRARSATPQR